MTCAAWPRLAVKGYNRRPKTGGSKAPVTIVVTTGEKVIAESQGQRQAKNSEAKKRPGGNTKAGLFVAVESRYLQQCHFPVPSLGVPGIKVSFCSILP